MRPGLTTNGTITSTAAWELMLRPELDLWVHHAVRWSSAANSWTAHSRRGQGQPTAHVAADTIERLLCAGRNPRVVMVVRPDSATALPQGIEWLWDRGVRRFDLSLDIWATWNRADLSLLEAGVKTAAAFWRAHLPDIAVNWFDGKAGHLLGVPMEPSARCGFGYGEIAVAPSGNLYPCERLIGDDAADNPMRIEGHVTMGDDFCHGAPGWEAARECAGCLIRQQCATACRCCNFIRTGDPALPDAFLCFLDQVCLRETARTLDTHGDPHVSYAETVPLVNLTPVFGERS